MTKETQARLNYLRSQIEQECISYSELAELQEYRMEIFKLGDIVLAEWAGISECCFSHPFKNGLCHEHYSESIRETGQHD